ncbi:MAG: flagellar biosynthetic protein FliQ [Planctomycetota bacterium]|jgi:flagellar biosynthesis protein FliQ|nr:flagellar biosynthetic protein FliQ [Planctomycetota bacterium]MDA1027150.1 flagellar biosynthetic protein FliQ [Planctomycetota bacterium]
MEIDALDLARSALMISLLIATPILVSGLLIGLVVSIAQAVTQIQEQTLSFVPKIAVMILVTVMLLGWISNQMVEFAQRMFVG